MEEFKIFLQEQRLSASTIDEHCNNVNRFIQWVAKENHLDAASVQYNDLLSYIQYEKQKGVNPVSVNLRLTCISWYFEYLKKLGEIKKNPARNLRVKGVIKKVVENPLSSEALQSLYHQYSQLKKVSIHQHNTDIVHQRNTVIVGLLVNQGVHSGELQKMEVSHVDLVGGKVYIPSTRRINSRTLQLQPAQILPIHEYLQETRSQLKPKGDELFPGDLHNIITRLVEELQGINPIITNALHIRGSVIINWLKLHNKRQVQYMAGHKYISSTEAYQLQVIDSLLDELSKHHPFG